MKHSQAVRLVSKLVAAFPPVRGEREVQKETLQVYADALADLDYEAAEAAVKRLIVSARFFPTVAEIRAEAARDGADRDGVAAWGDVLRAIGSVGMYGTPAFEDPIVAEAVSLMGWRNLCVSDQPVADRARFVELYEDLQGRAQRRRMLGSYAPPAPMLRGEGKSHPVIENAAAQPRLLTESRVSIVRDEGKKQ